MNDFLSFVVFCCLNEPFPAETAVVLLQISSKILINTDEQKG